jgi:hypothetical protein
VNYGQFGALMCHRKNYKYLNIMTLTKMLRLMGFVLLSFIIISCKKDDEPEITGTGNVNFEFEHRVGTQALIFGTQSYTNANGDDFKVTTFKYYVSNITLVKTDGTKVPIPESYLLINAADAASRLQNLKNIPAGDYASVDFIIGVDEPRNFAGAQTGALDPAKGMFWSWNTGYIFLMFEGTSSKSTQQSGQLFFHVGGAKDPANTIRTTSQVFPTTLRVRADAAPDVHFIVDIASLFKGKTTVNFASISGFHGGANGVLVADNYVSGLFKVDHIHN